MLEPRLLLNVTMNIKSRFSSKLFAHLLLVTSLFVEVLAATIVEQRDDSGCSSVLCAT